MGATAQPSRGTIAGRVLSRLLRFVEGRGHDGEALCARVGLARDALERPETRVPYGVVQQLTELAVALVDEPDFGLQLALSVPDEVRFDAGLLMLMASPTIGAGLERMVRFQRYWGDGERASLEPLDGGVCVRWAVSSVLVQGRVARHTDECALAEMVVGMRALSGRELVPRVVRFRHAAPARTTLHGVVFRCPIEFSRPHTELLLDDETLATGLPHANEAYCGVFEQQVQRALARLPREAGAADAVREAARATLVGGECSLARTARVLGVSTRTLQRRLAAQQTSFAALVDALRHELALEHLRAGIAASEVAFLLGYAEPSAFFHAFKRWTGTTPERVRPRA